MRIEIVRTREFSGARAVLAEACEAVAHAVARDSSLACSPSWPTVRLVLGGMAEADFWSVPREAMGFFAVMSSGETDEENEDTVYFEVNDHLEAHVNLDAAINEMEEAGGWDLADVESWLATIPHELLHVKEWMDETDGKTPGEVFDSGQGELSVKEVYLAVEARHAAAGNETEDAVERTALWMAGSAMTHASVASIAERLAQAAPAASRRR